MGQAGEPELFIRPNGRLYRPRKGLVAQLFEDDGVGLIVLRTHDRLKAFEFARALLSPGAQEAIAPEDGTLMWVRLVPWDEGGWYDFSWVDDPVRGVPAVVWHPRGER